MNMITGPERYHWWYLPGRDHPVCGVFGLTKGWKEINDGGDIRVPDFYKPIIKWITPLLLLAVFIGSLITPEGNDWVNAFQNGWVLDNGSIIKPLPMPV